MNKKIIVSVVGVFVIGGLWWFVTSNSGGTVEGPVLNPEATQPAPSAVDEEPVVDARTPEEILQEEGVLEVTSEELSVDKEEGSEVLSTTEGELVGGDAVAPEARAGEVSFTVLGSNFAYDLTKMEVKKGDTVTVTFRSTDGFHDWVVDEFSASTEQVSTGNETTVTFVADEVGEFEYYCSVGSHRAQGMVGTLVVTE